MKKVNTNFRFTFVVGELLPVTSPLVTLDSWHLFRSDSRRSPLPTFNADSTISDNPALRPDRASIELNLEHISVMTEHLELSTYWRPIVSITHGPVSMSMFSPHYVIGWHGKYFFVLQIINDEQTSICANADNAPVWVQWYRAHIRFTITLLAYNQFSLSVLVKNALPARE